MITATAFVIVIAGVLFGIWKTNGIPVSVSAIVYTMPGWVWSAWMVTVGLLLFPVTLERMPDNWRMFAFLLTVSVIGSALTPIINKDEKMWHNVMGVMTGIFSQVCVAAISPPWLFVWVAFVLKKCFWNGWCDDVFLAEMICVAALFGCLI